VLSCVPPARIRRATVRVCRYRDTKCEWFGSGTHWQWEARVSRSNSCHCPSHHDPSHQITIVTVISLTVNKSLSPRLQACQRTPGPLLTYRACRLGPPRRRRPGSLPVTRSLRAAAAPRPQRGRRARAAAGADARTVRLDSKSTVLREEDSDSALC
jgi:hypothetical protein